MIYTKTQIFKFLSALGFNQKDTDLLYETNVLGDNLITALKRFPYHLNARIIKNELYVYQNDLIFNYKLVD